CPSDHLFEQMDISPAAKEGAYSYGKGAVYILRTDPKDFVIKKDNSQPFVNVVKKLYDNYSDGNELIFKNNFYLERGAYDLVAVLEESVSPEPYQIGGKLIDLFDPELPVYTSKEIQPGEQGYFLSIDRIKDKERPQV